MEKTSLYEYYEEQEQAAAQSPMAEEIRKLQEKIGREPGKCIFITTAGFRGQKETYYERFINSDSIWNNSHHISNDICDGRNHFKRPERKKEKGI